MLDLEGVATDGEGGFWLASEGNAEKGVPHALHHVDASGVIDQTLALPDSLLEHQTRFGAEGIELQDDVLWVAMQRPWNDDLEHHAKLLRHDLASGDWTAAHYPLEASSVGLASPISRSTTASFT